MADSFTYEDIYELLRAEKFSAELQKITDKDLQKINEYLKVKERLISQEENTSIMSSSKKVQILNEIENARRTLSDLYEKRERKVINRAIVTIRSGSALKDTTNMLNFEVELYNNLIQTLQQNKQKFFNTLHSATESIDFLEKEMKEAEEMKNEFDLAEKTANVKKVKVEFLEKSEQFYGEDLKTYGPYSKRDTAELPEKIANLLREQKKVSILENESSKTNKKVLSEVQETHRAQNISDKEQAETKDKEESTEVGNSADGKSS